MAVRSRALSVVLLAVVLVALTGPSAFVTQPTPAPRASDFALAAAAAAATAAAVAPQTAWAAAVQDRILEASSITVAWQPWENPGIVWIFLMASFTMSIAL
eukprot:CAMPEP_0177473584 /NCGR_PEP_ID=MMETSP0369-20130122/21984_1 /TAXON_ID=447022 ORGANISM="Scrippsiella hangoei-like, Strain SHHI-4" /NCGR_SAMPLE_ID=MMETSP0369 /ASSEMBLY_ACC=CAM_ASM_000364 /LENGTH=100 /DNA_ID=CAMNT_0018948463 /DNA_START=34 /DNA_END=332 /DNA_ORIENTATION=+